MLIFTTSVITFGSAAITTLCQFVTTIKGKLMYGRILYVLMHLSMLSRSGGRPGVGGGFDVTSLPVAGTFDHSSSPGGRDF